jgi:hypothetical protein
MVPNDMHVDMYELHMEEVYRKVDHIKLLLDDKEPKGKETVHYMRLIKI